MLDPVPRLRVNSDRARRGPCFPWSLAGRCGGAAPASHAGAHGERDASRRPGAGAPAWLHRVHAAHLGSTHPAWQPARHPPRRGPAHHCPAAGRNRRYGRLERGLHAAPIRRARQHRARPSVEALRGNQGVGRASAAPSGSPVCERAGQLPSQGAGGRPIQHCRLEGNGVDDGQRVRSNGDARENGHRDRPRPGRPPHGHGRFSRDEATSLPSKREAMQATRADGERERRVLRRRWRGSWVTASVR